jgi:hypothetical protein
MVFSKFASVAVIELCKSAHLEQHERFPCLYTRISSPELLLPSSGNLAWKNRYLSKEAGTVAQRLPFFFLKS